MSKRADPDETSPGRGIRVGRLDTTEAVRSEMARLYRGARKKAGPLPTPSDAARLGYLLQQIGQTVLMREIDERLAAVEARQGGRKT
jgi:hypothetical protein